MSYENAPATKLLATQCCACGRPLVDAKSVETGMGPICREKHGFNIDVKPIAFRIRANVIVHAVAATQRLEPEQAVELAGLGFATLAIKLAERLIEAGAVEITELNGEYLVTTPFSKNANCSWRGLGRWDGARKLRVVPRRKRQELWHLLTKHFKGALLRSDNGISVI